MRKTIGLIINPIAGMGGKVALRGTDGKDILSRAIALGAGPAAESKAERALTELRKMAEQPMILTASGPMGGDLCRRLELPYTEVEDHGPITTADDTMSTARAICKLGAELLLFAGGDGTARNICTAVGEELPVVGIPAGVKIQSAVFALSPAHAGRLAADVLQGRPYRLRAQEVIDLDEDAYRNGAVASTLYGYMQVPVIRGFVQNMKQSGTQTDEEQLAAIADELIDKMDRNSIYAVGSGSTAKWIMRRLALPYELLGIDLVQDRQVIAGDVTEPQLYQAALTGRLRIIVSPIGGQGFLFGRGNQQFSDRVLALVRKDDIQIMATAQKLISIGDGQLRTDCGDDKVDRRLSGYYQVTAGRGYHVVMPCNREMIDGL